MTEYLPECNACGMPTPASELHMVKPQTGSRLHRADPDERWALCDVCYRTNLSTMWEFAEQYQEALPVARVVVQCTRLILGAIADLRKELRK